MSLIKDNIDRLWDRIDKVASRVGRNREDIELVAVSKGVGIEKIREAIRAGIKNIGESRLQEARIKYQELKTEEIEWHLVGHLQRNKVKGALSLFNLIQSGDRIELLRELERQAKNLNRIGRVLLQVNISDEETKGGFRRDEILDAVEEVSLFLHLEIEGLMGIGPLTEDKSRIRASFRRLWKLFEEIKRQESGNLKMRYLSMGMSQDFELAIEEGSNMLRIGRAIFG